MAWQTELVDRLADCFDWGYHATGPASSEPTALAALALAAHHRLDAARRAADWLLRHQANEGSLGITATQAHPRWPTSLCILAWKYLQVSAGENGLASPIQRALHWLLTLKGVALEDDENTGHDTSLVGWPWVESTHSWLEPTALAVMALRATGKGSHERAREAVRMLIDRQLPDGGSNYGNTFVLGQKLRPHVQPTGLVLLALAGEPIHRLSQISLGYLNRTWPHIQGTASRSFAAMALVAYGQTPRDLDEWLKRDYEATLQDGSSPYRLALLSLAGLQSANPMHVNSWPEVR